MSVSGCAPEHSLRSSPSVSLKPDSASPVSLPPRAPAGDEIVEADSFVDKYGVAEEPSPECSEIDFLIENAKTSCKADSFAEAHALLKKALASIKEKSEEDKAWEEAESSASVIASLYADRMPSEYLDSIPDEISMLVFQRQLSRSLDTLRLSKNDSAVLKQVSCQKGIDFDFPIAWNDRVYRSICFFARSRKGSLDKCLSRAAYYRPIMQTLFSDSGLPTDLSYLPLVESGFDPCAYSRTHACGIWQFMAATGARYGLRKSYWLDERRDPLQSTRAAVSYLKKLYNQFGDWSLALAAYNCGENGVAGALSRSVSGSYWRISLPRETRNYVPEFIAALIVAKNPECFGCRIPHQVSFDLDTAVIDKCVNLQAVADTLGITGEQLHAMNPHILHWCSPPFAAHVRLYLPAGRARHFVESYSRHPDAYNVTWYSYSVRPGDRLFSVSRQFRVPLEALLSLNTIGKEGRVAAGTKLLIPIPVHVSTAQAVLVAHDLIVNKEPSSPDLRGKGPLRYLVRQGDTVRELARLFRVSVDDICRWNDLTDRNLIAGQCLQLRKGDETFYAHDAPVPAEPHQKSLYAKHRVEHGETLFSIAKKLSVTVGDLMALNRLDPSDPVIFAGQYLFYKTECNARASHREPDTLFYRVCKGDNLYTLASSFSVRVGDIRQANNFVSTDVLKAGELIKIPTKHSSAIKSE